MIKQILKIAALFFLLISIVGAATYFSLTFIIKSEDTVVVPNLVGKNVVHVLELLSDLGLNTKISRSEYSADIPKDYVLSQNPEPGATIKKGRDIQLVLSRGTKKILVPNLTGLPLRQAQIVLEEDGLKLNIISNTLTENIKKDEVISQTPSSGTMINRDDSVSLLVSLGIRSESYMMPDIKGLTLNDAIGVIERNGLMLGKIKSQFYENFPLNTIVDQEPLSGYRVTGGTVVNLMINRKPRKTGNKISTGELKSGFFRYRLKNGFLKKHIRVQINSGGVSNNILDDLIDPGKDIWLLIPRNNDTTVFLYIDGKLIKTQVFYAW